MAYDVMFEPQATHYKTVSILGECCHNVGVVHLAKHLPTGEMVAVKKFNMDKVREETKLIEHEIILTRQLQHPNILVYYLAFVSGPEVFVISPLMGYRSCRDLLNSHFNGGLPEHAIALVLQNVVTAVEYLHRKGLIHRAIKASHILIDADGQAYLSGFRYACPLIKNGKWQRKLHSFPDDSVSNLKWLSPEVLEQNLQGYNEKSDIYSIGMLITELANGSEPFAKYANILMLTEKVRGAAPQLFDCTTLTGEETDIHGDSCATSILRAQAARQFTEGLHQITALCLQREPQNRPTANKLLSHPYFKLNRRGVVMTDLLKPAIPLSDRVACNVDDLDTIDVMDQLSNVHFYTCEWDF